MCLFCLSLSFFLLHFLFVSALPFCLPLFLSLFLPLSLSLFLPLSLFLSLYPFPHLLAVFFLSFCLSRWLSFCHCLWRWTWSSAAVVEWVRWRSTCRAVVLRNQSDRRTRSSVRFFCRRLVCTSSQSRLCIRTHNTHWSKAKVKGYRNPRIHGTIKPLKPIKPILFGVQANELRHTVWTLHDHDDLTLHYGRPTLHCI